MRRTKFTPNELILHQDYAELILRNIKHEEVGRVKVDVSDIPLVQNHRWHIALGYAITQIQQKQIRMHRLLLDASPLFQVDHINHDRLDNRRKNLRLCTKQQNHFNRQEGENNSSGRIGVVYAKREKKWQAQIVVNQKAIWLGYHKTFESAVRARKEAERKYFGEFAYRGNELQCDS
jgi:hypothetical protein